DLRAPDPDEHPRLPIRQTLDRMRPKPGPEHAIEHRRRTPALNVAEHGHAHVEAHALAMVALEDRRESLRVVAGPFGDDDNGVVLATIVGISDALRDLVGRDVVLRQRDGLGPGCEPDDQTDV